MGFNWIGKTLDGKKVILNQVDLSALPSPEYFNAQWESANADSVRWASVVDIETTGLNHDSDSIIEIGVVRFKFNKSTGEILSIDDKYSALQDPGTPLSNEITQITGLSDEDVLEQEIDWDRVGKIFDESHLIIAHNASFDRPFFDKKLDISGKKLWACSLKQIEWMLKGYSSPKLELLSIYHGFFTGSHRALNDAEALLFLLSHKDSVTGSTYFSELITNARKSRVKVLANKAPFETKDLLKGRRYTWDAHGKVWCKIISEDAVDAEFDWLSEFVYPGACHAAQSKIAPHDNFKK